MVSELALTCLEAPEAAVALFRSLVVSELALTCLEAPEAAEEPLAARVAKLLERAGGVLELTRPLSATEEPIVGALFSWETQFCSWETKFFCWETKFFFRESKYFSRETKFCSWETKLFSWETKFFFWANQLS